MPNDLIQYFHCLTYIELNTMAGNWPISQPSVTIAVKDYARKRSTALVDSWNIL